MTPVSAPLRRGARRPQVIWRSRGASATTTGTVVLINGYGASGMAWPREWLATLAADLRVITLDNRGSGWSRSADAPFTMEDLANDVVDVLDDAEVDQAVIAGLSMGGMIAQEVALRAPKRVTGLALVGTRPPAPRFVQPGGAAALALVRPLLPGETLKGFYRRLWTAAAAPGFAGRHPELIQELVDQTVERPTPRAMLLYQMRAMTGWGHAERLEELTTPTVVVHGELDTFAPVANGRALAALIPGARLELLPDVGHLVPLEAPEALSAVLRELATGDAPAARRSRRRAAKAADGS